MIINFSLPKTNSLASITKTIDVIWAGLLFLILTMCWSQLSTLIQQLLILNFCPDICSQNVMCDAQWCCMSKLRLPGMRYFFGVLLSAVVTRNAIKHYWEKNQDQRTLKVFLRCRGEISSPICSMPGHFRWYLPNLFPQFHPWQRCFSCYCWTLLNITVVCFFSNLLVFCKKCFVNILIFPMSRRLWNNKLSHPQVVRCS